jgi:hypothetical protein
MIHGQDVLMHCFTCHNLPPAPVRSTFCAKKLIPQIKAILEGVDKTFNGDKTAKKGGGKRFEIKATPKQKPGKDAKK